MASVLKYNRTSALFWCPCILIFIIGLVFYCRGVFTTPALMIETFDNNNSEKQYLKRCPNMLIQKGNDIFLYNSKLANIPGVNPIRFSNLEEYVEFIEWQKHNGIDCPVLFLKQSYTADGKLKYKVRPSPNGLNNSLPPNLATNSRGNGIKQPSYGEQIIEHGDTIKEHPTATHYLFDSHRDDPPYNKNSYPGFDKENQNIGKNTPLDHIKQHT
jgi:hypothetical protein